MAEDVTATVDRLVRAAGQVDTFAYRGRVNQVVGLLVQSRGPRVKVGDLCYIVPGPVRPDGTSGQVARGGGATLKPARVLAEAVGFREGQVLLMPLGEMAGTAPGDEVIAAGHPLRIPVGTQLLGRILDGLGRPIDHGGPVQAEATCPVTSQSPPPPLERPRITEAISVGVRAIDACLTCGKGQRLGIFSGSGVGKSTLLGMIARNTAADVSVVALVGERGREVREFLEQHLGTEGLARSVVVVSTSDQPALVRVKAAFTATAIAEYFRDRGADVMLVMDSITRFCMAQRELGLAVGEPPTARGYTPSVFALLPRLLERVGTSPRGTITAFYTVLVDGDDMSEPVADTMRSLLDGHVVLSRRLAAQGHYPAIDLLESVSRVMPEVADERHRDAAMRLKRVLAVFQDAEDLINVGAYRPGSNPEIDYARDRIGPIRAFLRQAERERVGLGDAVRGLLQLFGSEEGGA